MCHLFEAGEGDDDDDVTEAGENYDWMLDTNADDKGDLVGGAGESRASLCFLACLLYY